jgi:maltose alpha-D-glucosyltransferase/alpha-amylase
VTQRQYLEGVSATTPRLIDGATREPPESVSMLLEGYLSVARQLAGRTGELHLVLASEGGDAAFALERFTNLTKRSFYQSLRNLSSRSFDLLKERIKGLPDGDAELARQVLRSERELTLRLKTVLERPLGGVRMRVHGDYHLGQVLHTGKDFVIIDFEGEPARSPAERRRRRSPIADVAGMLRSFHYAVYGVLTGALGQVRPEDRELGEEWAAVWYRWVAATFLDGYLGSIRGRGLVPEDAAEIGILLDVHLLEKALYELAYELNNRPSWVSIPLRGILASLDAGA